MHLGCEWLPARGHATVMQSISRAWKEAGEIHAKPPPAVWLARRKLGYSCPAAVPVDPFAIWA